ncbi:hypothetical protein V5P93_004595 [Actinokineospora auranticolor]|uniref:Uncharacterized protein n=1 Tax=Actinokineospora auranticolor TaxID=155976 RepID=A0A2S6GSW6_9PSEU|nr:hypothetical protein CLV40_10523 [Actinokineospora auranticolor]
MARVTRRVVAASADSSGSGSGRPQTSGLSGAQTASNPASSANPPSSTRDSGSAAKVGSR